MLLEFQIAYLTTKRFNQMRVMQTIFHLADCESEYLFELISVDFLVVSVTQTC